MRMRNVDDILTSPIFTPELKVQIEDVIGQQDITEQFVDKIVRGIYKHGMLRGAPGLGKSHVVQTALSNRGLIANNDYIVIKGHCTAWEFFHVLYNYRHPGKFIVLDDCDIDADYVGLGLIRAAVDPVTKNRVNWHSNRVPVIDGVPVESFNFRGSIIICTNVFQTSGRKNRNSAMHHAITSRLPIRDVDWNTAEKKFAQIYNMVINADYLNTNKDRNRRKLTLREKVDMLAFIVEHINSIPDLDLRLPQKIAANICDTKVKNWRTFCLNTMVKE